MESFIQRYLEDVTGVLEGFDRIIFKGTIRALNYADGVMKFLSYHDVLLKDFGAYAESLSKSVKGRAEAIANENGRPFEYLPSAGIDKGALAEKILRRDGIKEGLVCVLSCVEPCQTFGIRKDWKEKKLKLVCMLRKCLYLYFYYHDRDFGLIHVRLQTWLPFTIQVYMNGREYLGRALERKGIECEKRGNCFTSIEDLAAAQKLMNRLHTRLWGKFLNQLARRVNPFLGRTGRVILPSYYWSVREAEYATDIMFKNVAALDAIYPHLVNHAVQQFSCNDVLRFLGRKTNTRFGGEVRGNKVSRPEGIRIKHRVEENSIKMYNKQGSILRVETTINNPQRFKVYREVVTHAGKRTRAWMPMRKGIADIARRVEVSSAANKRYLEALAVVTMPHPAHEVLDPVSRRVVKDDRPYRPLRPTSPSDAALFQAVLHGENFVQGFRNKDIRALVHGSKGDNQEQKRASHRTTRHLRLLRGHGLIAKIPRTQRYRLTQTGVAVMSTSLQLRNLNLEKLAA